jgi:FkbM family methyltransferase
MMRRVKSVVRGLLAQFGYDVRHVGPRSTLTGADLLHDAITVLNGKQDPLIFDIGANIGQTIEELLATFKRPRIYSFEPSPTTFDTLRGKFGGRPDITLENVAMGETGGTMPFHVTGNYSVNDSLLKPVWSDGGKEVPVRVDTVDEYCQRHDIPAIDLLKIDTQGYDLNVLRGAERMLRQGRITVFYIEVMFRRMYEGQPGLVEFASFAQGVGYKPIGFYEHFYIDNELSHVNICFKLSQK